MLEVDPITRTVSTFGNFGGDLTDQQCSGSLHCGEEKWIGGVLLPSTGRIIGIPYAAETVLEIDPIGRTTSTFGIVSSSVKRKWVDGVLGRNGMVYAIPYDADVVLEINPDTRALMLFGRVGADPCKWYGGVLGPNDKIYAIPYSSPYVLEIDPERRVARPFAMTYPHWGKWSGGVLAPNGKIYGMPALSKSVLEIDIEREQTSLFGMLPGGADLQDKWSGGVLAPNGRIYGLPWRSSKVLEFDPATKAISLLGSSLGSSNFSWGGGAVAKSGRIVAVPYNGAWVLEIGETVCTSTSSAPTLKPEEIKIPPPVVLPDLRAPLDSAHSTGSNAASLNHPVVPTAVTSSVTLNPRDDIKTFVLALLGCPDASKSSEDSCFHLSHRTWHSAMVTIMKADSTLHDIRAQVLESRLSHVPTNFCFLMNGHALDPNVEATIKGASVSMQATGAGESQAQQIILIDNVHCNISPKFGSSIMGALGGTIHPLVLSSAAIICIAISVVLVARYLARASHSRHGHGMYYNRVPAGEAQEAQALIGNDVQHSSVPCIHVPRLRPLFGKASRPTRSSWPEQCVIQPEFGIDSKM